MDVSETDTESDDPLGMTDAQWEWFQKYTRGYGDQDENGIYLSLLRANRKLTPTQRLEKHQRALKAFLEVRRAGRTARLRADTRRA
jgi:hypothetical protein